MTFFGNADSGLKIRKIVEVLVLAIQMNLNCGIVACITNGIVGKIAENGIEQVGISLNKKNIYLSQIFTIFVIGKR
jgi:hypothetical protein